MILVYNSKSIPWDWSTDLLIDMLRDMLLEDWKAFFVLFCSMFSEFLIFLLTFHVNVRQEICIVLYCTFWVWGFLNYTIIQSFLVHINSGKRCVLFNASANSWLLRASNSYVSGSKTQRFSPISCHTAATCLPLDKIACIGNDSSYIIYKELTDTRWGQC